MKVIFTAIINTLICYYQFQLILQNFITYITFITNINLIKISIITGLLNSRPPITKCHLKIPQHVISTGCLLQYKILHLEATDVIETKITGGTVRLQSTNITISPEHQFQHKLAQLNTIYLTLNNKVKNYDLGLIYESSKSWLKPKN